MSTFTFGFAGDDINDIDDQDVEIEEPDAGINAGIRQLEIAGKKNEGEDGVLIEASYCDLDDMVCKFFFELYWEFISPLPQENIVEALKLCWLVPS